MRHHEGTNLGLTRGLVLLTLELGDQLELIADTHVGQELVILEDKTQQVVRSTGFCRGYVVSFVVE